MSKTYICDGIKRKLIMEINYFVPENVLKHHVSI